MRIPMKMRSPGYIGYLLVISVVDTLLLSFLSASNIYRGSTFREAQFQRKYEGKIHAAEPFARYNITRVEHCCDKCLETTTCKSFNVNAGLTADNCHLIGEDRNTQYNYIDKEGWSHYDTGRTELTRIFHVGSGKCMVPGFKSCTFSGGYDLVFASGSDCDQPYAWFRFNRNVGIIFHMCSGTRFCPNLIKVNNGAIKFQQSYCPNIGESTESYEWKWKRSWDHHLSIFLHFCAHAYDASFSDGNRLITHENCNTNNQNTYEMRELGNGPVKVTVHSGVGSAFNRNGFTKQNVRANYPVYTTEYLDSFEYLEDYFKIDWFVMIMQAIFVAPETGEYIFYIGCDDWCKLFIGSNENEGTAYQIAHNDPAVDRYVYEEKAIQISSPISLVKDQKYYMEVMFREGFYGDWLGIAMKAPSYHKRQQLTTEHLYPIGI